MGPSLQVGPKPKTFIKRLFLWPITKRVAWRYLPVDHVKPANADAAKLIINIKAGLSEHPAAISWHSITPYTGAIYHALKQVDNGVLQGKFPEGDPKIPSMYIHPPIGIIQALKIFAGLYVMQHKFELPYLGALGVPTSWKMAFLYLSINAARNVASDLIPKHGLRPLRWISHLDHIKWNKLTDSLLVTAVSFPILYYIKDKLHIHFAGQELEWFITPAAVAGVDSMIQLVTRIERGFSTKVAIWDVFRPFVGDISATAAFAAFGGDYGAALAYLFTRKIFAELFSGVVEGADKRTEKMNERKKNLEAIFDLNGYNVPNPQAMAAINLVYLLRVKSVAREAFQGLFVKDELVQNADEKLTAIHAAMLDDKRVDETIDFIFGSENWKLYANAMKEEFRVDRMIYLKWLKSKEPKFFGLVPEFEEMLRTYEEKSGAVKPKEDEPFEVDPGSDQS